MLEKLFPTVSIRTVFVAEELEPFLEKEVRALAQAERLTLAVDGKMNGPFSLALEFSPDVIREALGPFFSVSPGNPPLEAGDLRTAPRPPVFYCGGVSGALYSAGPSHCRGQNRADYFASQR